MQATAPSRLALRGLRMSFGDRVVLESLDIDVRPGEIFGLLGPNGSGKSTTFSILTGLLRADAGQLTVDGQPTAAGARSFRARVGIVFQQPSLDPNLTARENLALTAALHRVPRGERAGRITELLELATLSGRADEAVSKLSGGMRRRLEIARALVHKPDILLMDEPTSGLDEASFRRIWSRLHALRDAEGLTILLTTHRPEEAAHCDRIALLDNGRVVAADTPPNLQRMVSGDILTLHGGDPAELAEVVESRFDLSPRTLGAGDGITLECERGHELIPRLVEAFPEGRLTAVNLHRPSLADVFLKLTGRALADDQGEEQPEDAA